MAKFKQVPQNYLLRKLLGAFTNLVKNYRANIADNDIFDILRNNYNHDRAVELIECAFTNEELSEFKQSRNIRGGIDLDDSLDCLFQNLWNNSKYREKTRTVLTTIAGLMLEDAKAEKKTGTEMVEQRFADVKRLLRLDELESEILILAYICRETCFSFPRRINNREKPLFFAMALDRSLGEVTKAMNAKGKLRKFNLLDDDWDFNGRTLGNFIDGTEAEALERRFYKKSEAEDVLPWEFYGELANTDGETIREMFAASQGKCNILFYGAPGTGKTSFARSLAKKMGLQAFEIRQGDEDGRNMESTARMMGIQMCNDQEDAKTSLMIVDEADELLRGSSCGFSIFGMSFSGGKSTEKGVMNTMLDEMKLPAIWISNAPAEAMDESVRRRFDYSVCFDRLNTAQRVSIWRNLVSKFNLGKLLSEEKIDTYAAKYETSAGGISTVLANVRRMQPEVTKVDALIEKLMKPHCRLMGVKPSDRFLPAKGYSLEGLNVKGKVSPERIVRAVRNYLDANFNTESEDRPRMNILLHGAPGTGKTEFVKFLGKALDRKVQVVKGSDLLDMYVGGTEKRIAEAFREAERNHAILFFDEVDGLVQDRSGADHSWEVSQVNELLQQMENFDGVMIAATNFSKNLDAAIMRRFTFKLEFDYLDNEGKKIFFEKMFKTELTREEFAELKELGNLAPGDFRTVRQELFYLGDEVTNLDRIAALREECKVKKDGHVSGHLGFGG